MIMKSLLFALSIPVVCAAIGFATPASAFSGGSFPACDEPQVLNYIQKRFVWTDRVLLKRGLEIERIARAHRSRHRQGSQYWSIPRLYCRGTAHMNDGRKRHIWWLIEGGQGFAGLRDNLEFCISGLDPLRAHGTWCRSVR